MVTISGTGRNNQGALYNSSNLNSASAVKNLILAGNATIGTFAGQMGIQNGFIQGNGNNLTFNNNGTGGSPYIFLANDVFDNLPLVTLTNTGTTVSNIVVNNMSFGTTVLTTTGKSDIQFVKPPPLAP